MEELTPRQEEVYRVMVDYFRQYQRMPGIRDLCVPLGIDSLNGVMCHLVALQRKGYLTGVRKADEGGKGAKARGIRFVGVRLIPVFDNTLAGQAARLLWVEKCPS